MPLNLSATRTSSTQAIQFKKLLARIYLALDESQRRRAAVMIRRYKHPIPDYDGQINERKQDRLTLNGIFDHIEIAGQSPSALRKLLEDIEQILNDSGSTFEQWM